MVTLLPPHMQPAQTADRPGGARLFEEIGDERRLKSNLPVYRKQRLLGQGAFGKAYLVESIRRGTSDTGAPVSQLKVLKKMRFSGIAEEQRESAHLEAMLMRRISRGCPFIVQFSEVFVGKGGTQLCLVMEYCAGGDLHQRLRSRDGQRFAEEEVLSWVAQVALALRHCHAHGVLHRDVKPLNCFFRSEGGALILGDFGISCALDERSAAKSCVGSPHYLSPEIIDQKPYSYSTDVWSLGVLMYESAMLEHPFKGSNICQIAFRIIGGAVEPLDATLYSPAMQQLQDRLLDKDPETRCRLDDVLYVAPLETAAHATCSTQGLPWPPPEPERHQTSSSRSACGGGRSGLVQRLRGHVQSSGAPLDGEGEYEDDFEVDECDEAYDEEAFEELSGSEASYEQDFEYESGDEAPALPTTPMGSLGEAGRAGLLDELGDNGYTIAECSVVPFLERVNAALPRNT